MAVKCPDQKSSYEADAVYSVWLLGLGPKTLSADCELQAGF